MILAVITFLLARVGISFILNWMVANTAALWAFLALLIFAGLGLSFVPGTKDKPSKAKKWGWICFGVAVLAYVIVGILPTIITVATSVIAAAIAIVVVIAIKRVIFKWLKTATVATWAAWLLRLI